jgi:phosphate-selective porin OprO/OprP
MGSFVGLRTLLLATSALALAGAARAETAAADPRDEEITLLKAQLKALAERVGTLEARQAAAPASSAGAPILQIPAAGGATMVAGRPSIQSADGRFMANLHGVMQFDAAEYSQASAGPLSVDHRRGAAATDTAHARDLSSGTDFRRARIGVDGRMFGDFEYNVLFDFGGAGEEDAGHIQELWLQYSGLKPFHARIGAFPPSYGLADQASTNGAPFLERPAIADMARSLAGGDYREAAEIWAAGPRWYANAAVTGRLVGVVNSQATGVSQPYDSQLGLIGRIAVLPLKGDDYLVHLGVHGSYAARPADVGGPDAAATTARYPITFQERPELRVDGTRLISTGAIDARHASTLGVEAAAQYGPFFIESEYERLAIQRRNPAAGASDPRFHGFYAQGSYVLTGEARRYNPSTAAFDGPAVDHPFSLEDGTWGAWEIALRYSDADLNYHPGAAGAAPGADAVRGGDQRIWAGSLNWYANAVVRFMLQYQDVRVDRLSPSAASFQTPVGAQIGQHFHTIALRSQLAF